MNEALDVLMRNALRIEEAAKANNKILAKLETEAFQATFHAYHRKGRLSPDEVSQMYTKLLHYAIEHDVLV